MVNASKSDAPGDVHKGLPLKGFSTVRQWRTWLQRNHTTSEGLWVRLAKKGSKTKSISYIEARDQAIAYGWIDGLRNALNEEFFAIRITPRRKRSRWSQINCAVAERLIAADEMAPAGLAEVAAAKADGRWESAYAGQATMKMHPELARALDKHPEAAQFFATISAANRFAILYRVHDAKRPETRARRIEQFVDMLARGQTLH